MFLILFSDFDIIFSFHPKASIELLLYYFPLFIDFHLVNSTDTTILVLQGSNFIKTLIFNLNKYIRIRPHTGGKLILYNNHDCTKIGTTTPGTSVPRVRLG